MQILKSSKINKLFFGVYITFIAIMHIFHEPWFDEAQSWQIARCASLKDMFFSIPHDEGHPPLWWLILMPFAKAGVPYEVAFTIISLIFCGLSAWLIIFKSPFRTPVKILLPFTYFLGYQTGIVTRPYGLLLLLFIFLAIFYSDRNSRPVPYIITMFLMCWLDAYGILICFGLCLTWLIEIFSEKSGDRKGYFDVMRDRRLHLLAILALGALASTILIIPASDALASNNNGDTNLAIRFLYLIFIAPADAIMSNTTHIDTLLSWLNLNPLYAVPALFLGGLLNFFLIRMAKKRKKILTFILPLSFLDIFSAFIYYRITHSCVHFGFILFFVWICIEQQNENIWSVHLKMLKDKNIETIKKVTILYIEKIMLIAFLIISIYWSGAASIYDILYPTSPSRLIASTIKDNGLEKYNILSVCDYYTGSDKKSRIVNTNIVAGVDSLPFLKSNVYYDLNNGDNSKGYIIYKRVHDDNVLKQWASKGEPDFLLGYSQDLLDEMSGGAWTINDYIPIIKLDGYAIWKDTYQHGWYYFYIHKDLLQQFPQFHEIKTENCFVAAW